MANKRTKAKGLTIGGKKDGARPSRKMQVSAALPANKPPGMKGTKPMASRMKRMAKMEASDIPV